MRGRTKTKTMMRASDPSATAPSPPVFRLRAVPILLVIAIGFGLPPLAVLIVHAVNRVIALPGYQVTWVWVDWAHAVMLLLALAAMPIVRVLVNTDFCLRWPPGRGTSCPPSVWAYS